MGEALVFSFQLNTRFCPVHFPLSIEGGISGVVLCGAFVWSQRMLTSVCLEFRVQTSFRLASRFGVQSDCNGCQAD